MPKVNKFEMELMHLGLKDKEAAVYIACLELGSAPVQQIARRAKVVRATTYVVLESLMKKGLVTKADKDKKTLFAAEPPLQLMRLLDHQQEALEEKKEDLKVLLPELQALRKEKGTATVRYFEGKEGQHAVRQEINMYCEPGDMIYNFTPADHLTGVFPDHDDTSYPQRVARGIKAKTIFTTKSEKLKDHWLKQRTKISERRFLPADKFPFTSGITIYKDRIAIGNFSGNPLAVVIENKSMSDMMRCLFELAWESAEKYTPKKST
jgi:sugar-specific transcriptional regulator TrmB